MKKIFALFFLITTPFFLSSQVLWDDFEQNRIGYYEFTHGGMTTRYANPDISSPINSSTTCAQYVRNPGELYDVIMIIANGLMYDVSDYVNGNKVMSVDLYIPATGIPIQITLEDSSLAGPTNYPTGRHSIYIGQTTATNEWETINLTFDSQPDPTMSDVGLTSLILLFNPGINSNDTYYFDNLNGPSFDNQCDGLIGSYNITKIADWDCNWELGICPSNSFCSSFDFISGWLNQSYNPDTNSINTSKYCGEYTKNPDNNGIDILTAYFKNRTLDSNDVFQFKLYGPQSPFSISFIDTSNNEVLHYNSSIINNNNWQEFSINLSSLGNNNVSNFILQLDSGMVNWNTYYIDDFEITFVYSPGCTDSLAYNFDSTATFDDGSCLYCDLTTSFTNILPSDSIICDGVSIVTANSSYPIVSYSWEDQFGNIVSTNDYGLNLCNDIYFVTVVDSSGCTSLDTLLFGSIYGCTDPLSFNYFWGATVDDGSCIATVYGCTDSLALNYDSTANIDDGSCCLINQLLGQIGQDIDGEAAGDYSGWSVSLSSDGNRVAIGAPFNDGNGSGAGHVRIYENISGTWSQIGQDIDGEADDDMFGFSLSSSSNGSVVAIGAYRNDENGSNSGHVRIYENIGGSWSQIGQDIDGEAADDFFGYSVSLSSDGSTVAIGASALLVPGSGYVRIYENIVGTWSQIGQDIDGEATDDQSGTSVSLSSNGSTVAIGAPLNDGNGLNSGHVRIYENFGGIWTQIGQDINGEATDDQSGTSVSLSSDGSTVAIGATGNDGNGSTSGHVRIYENIVGTWSQIGQDIDGESVGDNSGWSVSLSSDGNRVAIGAYGIDAGHVRIYENIGGSWFQIGQDIDGESVGDNSGYSVSLSSDGNSVAIGAPWSFSSYSGYVRVFNSSTSLCAGCIDPLALNYDSTFAYDDGSCIYPTGCTDPTAYNYDTIAITDDGSCLYCDLTNTFVVNNNTPGNCNGFIIANSSSSNTPLTYLWSNGGTGTNITGLCAGVYSVIITDDVGCQIIDTTYIGLFGCTDSLAFNYDSLANFDDGSCIPFIYGCTDSLSLNYNSFANTDDGSCLYCVYGCIDLLACNYDSLATCDDGSCLINYGCTDTLALNYDALAQCDDGSCLYCIYGCMDPAALNYDINATCDDGSCSYSSNCSSPKPNGLYSYDVIDTRAKIGWNNMNDANCIVLKYFVRYREVGTNSWTTKSAGVGNGLCIFGLNTVDKQLLNLTASTAYEFKMKAFYCGGTSSNYSPVVQFTTSDVCPEMTNLIATTFNGNQSKVRFNWDTTGAYTFARILLRVDTAGANWQTAGGFGVYYPTCFINKFGLQSGESYRAQGRTFCDSNITAYRSPTWTSPIFWTQPGSIRIDGGVSINNLDVYPNPSRDLFNISFNSDKVQDLSIRILNIVGAEIYKETKDQFIGEYTKQISLDNYGKGIYFLEIETNDGVINKKLILQ